MGVLSVSPVTLISVMFPSKLRKMIRLLQTPDIIHTAIDLQIRQVCLLQIYCIVNYSLLKNKKTHYNIS